MKRAVRSHPGLWALIALGVIGIFMSVGRAQAADIWLSGLDQMSRDRKDPGQQSDFMDLFVQNSPWKRAASKVSVFKVSTRLLLRGNEADLRRVFAGLRARHIALAVELGLLSGSDGCGMGIEGYSSPRAPAVLAHRVKRLGGNLAYVALDEQLWFGRFSNRLNACHSPISAIATEVAGKVRQIKAIFPKVVVGDIEPVGTPSNIPWVSAVNRWLVAYREASGSPLAFFHADMQWNRGNWQYQAKAIAGILANAGIPFGVIADSDRPSRSGREWVYHAQQRLAQVRGLLGNELSQIIVQSWQPHPRRFLPETDPGTLTNLVLRAATTN